jgi:FkbM family methyltransferase
MIDAFVSYAQNFEDVMLWRALQNVRDGFYIDVGAYSPEEHSVTKAFYDRGWRGINVEPNADLMNAFGAARPRDININVALGEREGDAWIHVINNTGLSTLDPHQATLRATDGYTLIRRHIQLRTLAGVWEEHVPNGQAVHFLKVDVEGMEREVVLGNDWRRYRPWIVLMEATYPMSSDASHDAWEHLIVEAGYRFAYADGLNRFYVSSEHSELISRLSTPPNVFDQFVRASENALLERAERAEVRAVAAETEILAIRKTLSWRLTRPLRHTSAVARNVMARLSTKGDLRRR